MVAGPEGGMDATPVQDGDSGACVDRSAPACQPKVIGPAGDAGDAGRGLTVIGKNAYWTRVSKPLALLRTSLDDDQTTDLPIPPSVPEDFAFFEARYLVNDGTNVFAASTYCCAGPENALFGYYVSDGSWKSTDLANSLGVSGFLYASGSLTVALDAGRFLYSYSPGDLKRTKSYVMANQYADPIGTDGTTIYIELLLNGTRQIASFDGMTPVPLATVPAEPYGSESHLAVDETNVYFAAMSKLMSADRKTPGDPKEIVDVAPLHPLQVLVDDRALYWVDESGLHAIGKSRGGRVDLATFDNRYQPLAVEQIDQSAEYVVWTGRDGLSKVRKSW